VEFKASHPDEKGVSAVRSAHPHIFNWFWVVGCVVTGGALQVGKAGGEKWRSMTEEEKKPYIDQAKELKAKFDSGEGSAVIFLDPAPNQTINVPFMCVNLTLFCVLCLTMQENDAGDEKVEGDAEEVEEEEQEVDQPEKEEEDAEEEEKNELDDDI
jgi:hypothetical protein